MYAGKNKRKFLSLHEFRPTPGSKILEIGAETDRKPIDDVLNGAANEESPDSFSLQDQPSKSSEQSFIELESSDASSNSEIVARPTKQDSLDGKMSDKGTCNRNNLLLFYAFLVSFLIIKQSNVLKFDTKSGLKFDLCLRSDVLCFA